MCAFVALARSHEIHNNKTNRKAKKLDDTMEILTQDLIQKHTNMWHMLVSTTALANAIEM